MRPPHPGSMIRDIIERLREETGQTITNREIAEGLGVTPKILSNILNEHQGISSEMAIRLSEAFGSRPDFWLKLQVDYELWKAEKKINKLNIKHFWKPKALQPICTYCSQKVSTTRDPGRARDHNDMD